MRFFLMMLLILPVIEIWPLIVIGDEIGVLPTIAWLILAAIIGINLIRYLGVATMFSVNQQLRRGEVPAQAVVGGMMMGVAGVLFVIPGFVSDFIAVLLLIPPLRRGLLNRWLRNMRVKTARYQGNVYDVEAETPPPTEPEKIGRTLEGEFRRDDKQ